MSESGRLRTSRYCISLTLHPRASRPPTHTLPRTRKTCAPESTLTMRSARARIAQRGAAWRPSHKHHAPRRHRDVAHCGSTVVQLRGRARTPWAGRRRCGGGVPRVPGQGGEGAGVCVCVLLAQRLSALCLCSGVPCNATGGQLPEAVGGADQRGGRQGAPPCGNGRSTNGFGRGAVSAAPNLAWSPVPKGRSQLLQHRATRAVLDHMGHPSAPFDRFERLKLAHIRLCSSQPGPVSTNSCKSSGR